MNPPHRPSPGRLARVGILSLLLASGAMPAQEPWSDKDTRLANEYLSLLVDQPEYGRVVDLLWDLYRKRESTALLLENLHTQAAASPHPSVLLVEAHLVRKSGDLKKAAALYDAILKQHPDHALTLQSRADIAMELGDPGGAAATLKTLLKVMPENDPAKPGIWMQVGDLALVAGSNSEAAAAWEWALKLKPDDLGLARTVSQHLLRAGYPERAAGHLEKLASQSDPAKRLDALLDLARVHEHADQPQKADQVLLQALGLLDFRDARYQNLLQRRIRLHERFGTLEDLRGQLLAATRKEPVSEQSLYNMSRFHALTAEPDEQIIWLRLLVKQAPGTDLYRWELVRALLDHEGAAEAARLLDERLRNPATDIPSLILLRAEADLRQGATEAGVARLEALLKAHPVDPETEKQVLSFAQERSLDILIERILTRRMERDPGRPEPVFELATFHRTRDQAAKAATLLRSFAERAGTALEQARRFSDAAAFLSAGGATEEALTFQREAAKLAGDDKEQLIRLADYLLESGDSKDVIGNLEHAVAQARTPEERTDIDERLFSLRMGTKAEVRNEKPSITSAEFRLPSFITGEGFGSDAPAAGSSAASISKAAVDYAENLIEAARQPGASEIMVQRAIWWAHHAKKHDELDVLLRKLLLPPPTTPLDSGLLRFLLDIALAEENHFFASRLLQDLIRRDSGNRTQYLLRLAEIALHYQLPGKLPDRAIMYLKEALKEKPDSEPVLSALSQCYVLNGKLDEAIKLWKPAIEHAKGSAAVPLRERWSELLLKANRLVDYVENQLAIVEAETDIKRRREQFKRFMDRISFSDARGGELAEGVLQERMKLVEVKLLDQTRRHPFDGFYQEALATVYERRGDAAKAFTYMRQAYYISPDTPFSLEQLRDSALRSSDSKSAIYFQKQIVGTAPASELAAESRRLVQMLEASFQIAEADKVRRRLESRFAQDPSALEDLARHYRETGQDDAERRVYEQIQKVKSWDARGTLRLALKCLSLADEPAALLHFQEVLSRTQSRNTLRSLPPDRWPFPLVDDRPAEGSSSLADVAGLVGESRALPEAATKRLRSFLTLPRPEFALLPDDISFVRLRALEETARLLHRRGGQEHRAWIGRWSADETLPVIERLWALYHAEAGTAFHQLLTEAIGRADSLDLRFVHAWLLVKSGGMKQALDWLNGDKESTERRQEDALVLQTVLEILAESSDFHFKADELALLGRSEVLRNGTLAALLRRLQDGEAYQEAMVLAECLREKSPELYSYYSFVLANFAQSSEDWDKQRAYLHDVLRGPLEEGSATGNAEDAFILSVVALHRLARTPQERQDLLKEASDRIAASPPSTLNEMRRASIAALAGADQPAERKMSSLVTGSLLANRTLGVNTGSVMPQDPFLNTDANHLRGYWEDLRLLGGVLAQQGLGRLMADVDDQVQERLGGIQLGPRTSDTFGQWRSSRLIRMLRGSDHPTRLRLIREHLAAVDMREEDSVETLSELGRELEVNGMLRECIEVYRGLPARAPTNNAYAEYFIRVCEQSWEPVPGREYVESLFGKDPVYKPQGIGDETLREKHARYLALEHDVERLRQLGWKPGGFSRVLPGRIPPEIPYLRELALLLEKQGDKAGALVAWDRFEAVWRNGTPHQPLSPDVECALHRVRLHEALGTRERAHPIAVTVPVKPVLDDMHLQLLQRRAELAADLGKWDDVHELMTLSVDRKSLPLVLTLSAALEQHQRVQEALSFVTQAERSLKGPEERFQLRLELLRLLALDKSWNPRTSRPQVSALFRTGARDEDALKRMQAWLATQAKGPHATAWATLLKAEAGSGPDTHLAAAALAPFAVHMTGNTLPDEFSRVWKTARDKDRVCMLLTASTFLTQGRHDWAWAACQALRTTPSGLGSRLVPLSVEVAGAQKDVAQVQELFKEATRLQLAGGWQTAEWTRAFERIGRADLARELFNLALEGISPTFAPSSELVQENIAFLLRQKDYDAAEHLLQKHYSAFIPKAAPLIVSLYKDWGRLGQITQELPKYFLPFGLEKEVLFLAKQATTTNPRP